MRCLIRVLLCFLAVLKCNAQQVFPRDSLNDASRETELIMRLTGCTCAEEMDPDEMERLSSFLSRPLRINAAGEKALAASGLFSRYQIASLADYRSRHGDIMSYSELSAVDGFGESFTAALAPFVSLDAPSYSPGARAPDSRMRPDIAVKAGVRDNLPAKGEGGVPAEWTCGIKAKASGRRLDLTAGVSYAYACASPVPSAFTGSLAIDLDRLRTRVVLGDFNARFGQGLALWNGLSIGSSDSPSSFMKKPSGISRSWSYTGSMAHTGIAAEYASRNFSLSVLAAVPGVKKLADGKSDVTLLPALNAAWLSRSGQMSVTHYAEMSGVFSGRLDGIPDMKTAVDASFCIRGADVFSEASFDWISRRTAVLAGTVFPVGEDFRMASMVRYYPSGYKASRSGASSSSTKCSGEYSVVAGGEYSAGKWVRLRGRQGSGSSVRRHSGAFSADAAFFPDGKAKGHEKSVQLQARARSEHWVSDCVRLSLRVTFRYRTWGDPIRTDCRADIAFMPGRFSASARFNVLSCSGTGFLGYAEGGYKVSAVSAYLRQGFFSIDNWNDRIYVYERDAPGAFTVPAFYGRGIWTSAVFSWRFAGWGRLWLRASCTSYPFMKGESKKPGKAELKVQLVFSL